MSYYIPSTIKDVLTTFDCTNLINNDQDKEYLKSYELTNDLNTGFEVIPECMYHSVKIKDPKGFEFTISLNNYFEIIKHCNVIDNKIITPLCYNLDRTKDVNTPINLIWSNHKDYIQIKQESVDLELNQFKIIDLNKIKPAIVKGRNDRDVYLGRYLNVNTNKKEYLFCGVYNLNNINDVEDQRLYTEVQKTKSKKYDIVERELTDEELNYFKENCIYNNADYYKIESIKKTPCDISEVNNYQSNVYYGVQDSINGTFNGGQYILNRWSYKGIEYKLKPLMDPTETEYINPKLFINTKDLEVPYGYKFDEVFKIEYILTSGYKLQ